MPPRLAAGWLRLVEARRERTAYHLQLEEPEEGPTPLHMDPLCPLTRPLSLANVASPAIYLFLGEEPKRGGGAGEAEGGRT